MQVFCCQLCLKSIFGGFATLLVLSCALKLKQNGFISDADTCETKLKQTPEITLKYFGNVLRLRQAVEKYANAKTVSANCRPECDDAVGDVITAFS